MNENENEIPEGFYWTSLPFGGQSYVYLIRDSDPKIYAVKKID